MLDVSADSNTLATLASLVTLGISIGNMVFALGRSGVSKKDLKEEVAEATLKLEARAKRDREEHDREFLLYKQDWTARFLEYQKHQAELRHDLLNHFDARITPLAASDVASAADRRRLSERISELAGRVKALEECD